MGHVIVIYRERHIILFWNVYYSAGFTSSYTYRVHVCVSHQIPDVALSKLATHVACVQNHTCLPHYVSHHWRYIVFIGFQRFQNNWIWNRIQQTNLYSTSLTNFCFKQKIIKLQIQKRTNLVEPAIMSFILIKAAPSIFYYNKLVRNYLSFI